jgi:hypothetical protein
VYIYTVFKESSTKYRQGRGYRKPKKQRTEIEIGMSRKTRGKRGYFLICQEILVRNWVKIYRG